MSNRARNPMFTVVTTIADHEGVVAEITERIDNGRCSFALYREFEKDGKTRRSSFMNKRHIDSCRRLLDELEEQLDLYEDRARAERRLDRHQSGMDFDGL